MNTVVFDGASVILGRLASTAAKQALLGKNVVVVNCEKVLVSGARATTVFAYKEIRAKGGYAQKGPYFPTQPAMIVKRTIRGMLSYKEGRGAQAFKKIRCYEGVPKQFEESKRETLSKATHISATSLNEISEELR